MKHLGILFGTVILGAIGGYSLGKLSSKSVAHGPKGKPIVVQGPGILGGGNTGGRKTSNGGSGGGNGQRMNLSLMRQELETIKKDSNPINRFASLTNILGNLSEDSLPDVLKAFEEIPLRYDHREEYQMLLYAWAEFDPEGALKYVEKNGNSRSISKDVLINPVISSWASVDPESTLAWINEIPEKDRDEGLVKGLIEGWATKDPYAAADYLTANVEAGKERESLAGEIVSHLFKQNPSEAATWAEKQADPAFKSEAFQELAEDWASVDPSALAGWLGDHVEEEHALEAFEDLARGWVSQDPEAATAFYEELPDGKAKEQGIYEMARTWGNDDLAGLGEWLNSLPDARVTDLGVKAYSERLASQSLEGAVTSALSITDDTIRDETVQRLGQQWFAKEPEAATAWATENSVPIESLQRPNQPVSVDGAHMFGSVEAMREVSAGLRSGNLSAEQLAAQAQALEQLKDGSPRIVEPQN